MTRYMVYWEEEAEWGVEMEDEPLYTWEWAAMDLYTLKAVARLCVSLGRKMIEGKIKPRSIGCEVSEMDQPEFESYPRYPTM